MTTVSQSRQPDIQPPRYTSRASSRRSRSSERLPDYAVSLENKRGKKWFNLHLRSRTSGGAGRPVWFEGDSITGTVMLDLDQPENIKAVIISIQGRTTFAGSVVMHCEEHHKEELLFLNIKHQLWSPADGNPLSSSSANCNSCKLQGIVRWPFSIPLPKEIKIDGQPGMWKPPPSFSENAGPAFVEYKLIVILKRPLLRSDYSLRTTFGYCPITHPDPPSELRQLAIQMGSPPLGPDGDPAGWTVHPPVRISGVLFGKRDVEIECTLAIANPPTYAIGSSLPFLLTLKSADALALDLLSAPSAQHVHLMRTITAGTAATGAQVAISSGYRFDERVARASLRASSRLGDNDHQLAGGDTRVLEGEVQIKKSLKPSFVFPMFTVRYSLDLFPFEAPGFVSTHEAREALISANLTVVTAYTPDSSFLIDAPPTYGA